jgi:hypothetical protein
VISPDEYNSFVIDWYADRWPHQRFGQAFVNKFVHGASHPELFYEENLNKAKELAWQEYVDIRASSSQ